MEEKDITASNSINSKSRYIGVSYGAHDYGIVVFDQEGTLIFCSQGERILRRKSHHLQETISEQLKRAGLESLSPNDHLFTVRPNAVGQLFAEYAFELKKDKNDFLLPYKPAFEKYNFYHVDHHLSHAAASWMFRENYSEEDSLYLVFDGTGFKTNLKPGFYSIGTIGNNGIKEIENEKLKPRQYASSNRLDHIRLPDTNPLGVAGKLMGLAGHCTESKTIPFSEIPDFFTKCDTRFTELGNKLDEQLMTDYGTLYLSYINDLKDQLGIILSKYPNKNVVVGGGTFLALELNTFIAEQGRTVLFGPPVNDSGIALGAGAFGYFLLNKKWPKNLEDPFIQWCPPQRTTPYISPEQAAHILVDKMKPIGLIIGKGEIGPRALGHRSLLAVPTMESKVLLSETIKVREYYRPVAPIVTDRDFPKLFTGPQGKYMQYRNHCTPLAKQLVPGVVHNDNTARAQVLERKDNPWLYDVLVEVGKKTGAECLINTSLNGPGKPISNTIDDVKNEMDTSKFELIVMD
ncbi:MAG: hypothetical protein K9M11_02920 [Candidatus Pacebacteria bacterium]|nr:hypothetical protein [Candidatus Paceibacterota bacterium]